MEKIKIVMDELDVRELCLSVTHEYNPNYTKIKTIKNELCEDITVTVDRETYTDKIYGRKIMDKYYFARHEFINKERPDIDYYDEFFCNGEVIL
jgi:hypothetical protein